MPILHRRRFPLTSLVAIAFVAIGLALSLATSPAFAEEATQTADRVAMLVALEKPDEATTKVGMETGLPVPRFVSLKFATTNLRVGPGTKYAVSWKYNRKGLPVEVIQEFDRWRRIRDADGTTGWVLHSLLSARRTAIVAPWRRGLEAQIDQAGNEKGLARLALLNGKKDASHDAGTVARFQPGLQVGVEACTAGWCSVEVQSVKAWLEQDKLWGVYRNEKVGG